MERCSNEPYINYHNDWVAKLPDSMKDDSGDSLEDIGIQNTIISFSQAATEVHHCTDCHGMAVDLSTGKLFCGLRLPEEVFESNLRIQQN